MSNAYPLNSANYTYLNTARVQSYASDVLYHTLQAVYNGLEHHPKIDFNLDNILLEIIRVMFKPLFSTNKTIIRLEAVYNKFIATHVGWQIPTADKYLPYVHFFREKIRSESFSNLANPLLITNIIQYIRDYIDHPFLDYTNFSLINNHMLNIYKRTNSDYNTESFTFFLIDYHENNRTELLKYNINIDRLSLSDLERLTLHIDIYIKQHQHDNFDRLVAQWTETIINNPESKFDRFITAIHKLIGARVQGMTKMDIYKNYIFIALKTDFDKYLESPEHLMNHKRLIREPSLTYEHLFAEIMTRFTLSMVNIETATLIITAIYKMNNLQDIPTQDQIEQIFKFKNYNFQLKYLKYKQKYLELKNKMNK